MEIQSSSRSKRQRTAKPKLTKFGRLDRDLSLGLTDSVDLNSSQAEYGKKKALTNFRASALHHSVFGGVAGLACFGMQPLGAVVGTATGLYVAWNRTLRKDTGKVEICLDGQERKARYFHETSAYLKTPQEVRAEMMADGRLGEQIPSYVPKANDIPKVKVGRDLTAQKNTFINLAKERKLVAAFRQKSRYGRDTLNLVDATLAARLIAADRPVYAVAGHSEDNEHTYRVDATNNRGTVRHRVDQTYVERTYEYHLHPLTDGDSLKNLPDGEGLPEGFAGVYQDGASCTQVVAADEQDGFGHVNEKSSQLSFASHRRVRDPKLNLGRSDKAKVVRTSSINIRDLMTLSGVAGGMVTGMFALPGVPVAALVGGVFGGIVGRELGWFAQDHMPGFRANQNPRIFKSN